MPEKPRGERTCFAAFVCNARNLGMGQTRPPGLRLAHPGAREDRHCTRHLETVPNTGVQQIEAKLRQGRTRRARRRATHGTSLGPRQKAGQM